MAASRVAKEVEYLVTCPICSKNFKDRDPRSLTCMHSFCVECLDEGYQVQVAFDPSARDTITCPKCSEETILPQGSVYKIPKYYIAEILTAAIEKISLECSEGVSPDTESLITTGKPQLMWSNNTHTFGIGFLGDGNIIIVTPVDGKRKLTLYNQSGNILPLPLDTSDPRDATDLGYVLCLAAHHATDAVVVTGHGSFTMISTDTIPWTSTTYRIGFMANAVAFTPDGQHVVMVKYRQLIKYTITGDMCWAKKIPGCTESDMTVTKDGRIIIRIGSTSRFHIYSSDGVALGEIPQQENRDKVGTVTGLCVDSEDNIYTVNSDRGVVCMLDRDGTYIKDVVDQMDIDTCNITHISLYKDKLLVVGQGGGYTCLYKWTNK